MKLYSENNSYKLYNGNMLDMLEVIQENSITSIVTDPPYEWNFLSGVTKGWDKSGIAFNIEAWKTCFKVLKPGGYLLAFCGSRTFHRMVCAIEDAGFEIKDVIMYLYGSGMPKSSNVGKMLEKKFGHPVDNEFYKYGNALKPAYEPIVIARKPFEGSMVENMFYNNVGALNIDECRIPLINDKDASNYKFNMDANNRMSQNDGEKHHRFEGGYKVMKGDREIPEGRFPANVILSYDDENYDEVCGGFPQTGSGNNKEPYNYAGKEYDNKDTSMFNGDKPQAPSNYNDYGSASRYFYCAKATRKDRDEGLKNFEKNFHPTCKPVDLMKYLVRLVTPKGGIVLDCFNGSGSTGKAVMSENYDRNADYKYIGIELTEEYLPIAKARIEYAINHDLKEKEKHVSKPKKKEEMKHVSKEETLW